MCTPKDSCMYGEDQESESTVVKISRECARVSSRQLKVQSRRKRAEIQEG